MTVTLQRRRETNRTNQVIENLHLNPTHNDMEVGWAFITPIDAAYLLEHHNPANRSPKPRRIDGLVRSITDGLWREGNPDALGFDVAGNIANGQNRLHAIARSEQGVWMLVVTGIPHATQPIMDTGASRSFADTLHLRGKANAKDLASATRVVWSYEAYGCPVSHLSREHVSNDRLLATLERHPGIEDYVEYYRTKIKGLPQSIRYGLLYLFSAVDQAAAEEFFQRLHDGAGLHPNNPIYALRERLSRENEADDSHLVTALVIRAFNAWRAGQVLTKMQAPRDLYNNFPTINGCPVVILGAAA